MKLFKYYGYIYGDHVAGIVKAEDENEAKEILESTYSDYSEWRHKTIEEIKFDNNICEIYYG